MNEVVRVATLNNFNCTNNEWIQLKHFEEQHPDKSFFVNCNINTPKLQTINNYSNKVVITVNPNLTIDPKAIARLNTLKKNRVAFLRIKYLPDHQEITDTITQLSKKYPIVLTIQRFNSKKSLLKYTTLEHYEHSCSRFRLAGKSLKTVTSLAKKLNIHICDKKGLGCQACHLCSKLTTGATLPVTSLNLSTSGICPYNCPDCYAKTMQRMLIAFGQNPISYDNISKNNKQAGRTQHILNHSVQLNKLS